MSKPAITIENLGKQYKVGLRERMYNRTFGEAIVDSLRAPFRRLRHLSEKTDRQDTFWALKDVSFEVQRGEVVGIIGRNGAGKSTLLKILSRVTDPTTGRAIVRGRTSSLLEVGTGFHPELTGRENIYLNGAILGMKKVEIDRRFDEIVAFAEVEKFLDMPVKHYSSGMYVRLAFAVSAHLDPEILMVDEVLAVGDAEFQRKCLGKMKEVAGGGRTVLFVSHNMGAIGRLCGAAIVLQEGRVYFWGDTFEAIKQYSRPLSGSGTSWTRNPPFPDKPHLRHMYLCDESGRHVDNPASSGRYGIAIEVAVPAPKKNLLISVGVHSGSLYPLFSTESVDGGVAFGDMTGICRTRVMLPDSIFMPKEFVVGASLRDWSERYDSQMDVLRFSVLEVPSLANQVPKGRIGDLQLLCQWQKLELMEG